MPEPELHPISAAGLLVTDWCSARCRHCYVSSGPAGVAWMTVDAAAAHLAALARLGAAADALTAKPNNAANTMRALVYTHYLSFEPRP